MNKTEDRKIVIINQAVNYLTIGFANAFQEQFENVALITGNVHVQGEELKRDIHIERINKTYERPTWKKMGSFFIAMVRMWWLLITRYRNYEVFFVSVPPMGYLLNLVVPHRFSMVIWDIYPDAFKIIGMKEDHIVYRIWTILNKKSFNKALKVFTISEKMAELLSRYVPREKIIVQPIWSIFQENNKIPKSKNPFVKQHGLENKFVVQYSGNIGMTHNVESLVDIAEILQEHPSIEFQIIGRGPRKPFLENLVKERNLPNCTFLPFQSDEMFPFSLSAADMGVVILDEKTSKGSVPSKSYNLMSFGIPSLYIASKDSQLALYAEKYGHAKCFSKAEIKQAAKYILEVSNSPEIKKRLSKKAEQAAKDFRRNNADKFVSKYLI